MASLLSAIVQERITWAVTLFMLGLTYVAILNEFNIWVWGTYAVLGLGALLIGARRVRRLVSTPG